MKILSIETSCDETSAAVVTLKDNKTIEVLSNITATSLAIHATTGGIIPENAAREQIKYIIPVITEALLSSEKINLKSDKEKFVKSKEILEEKIDAIAVTYGPGLIGSLLVGVETAKTLSYVFNKPIIPVNHLLAHLFANFITNTTQVKNEQPEFPLIGLIVSGGHTDLLYFETFSKFKWLGGTRDDAAGEALDKIGRILNLTYPAGPEIEERAKQVKTPEIKFQSPLIYSKDFEFSFSGLKAEVARFVEANKDNLEPKINQICFAVQKAIIDVLIKKTIRAAKMYKNNTILIGGGVSANQALQTQLKKQVKNELINTQVFSPERKYSTDNAAMIGAYALLNYEPVEWNQIKANPELYFD